jgi:hypothetical protein
VTTTSIASATPASQAPNERIIIQKNMYKVERDEDIPAIKARDKTAASKLKRHIKM